MSNATIEKLYTPNSICTYTGQFVDVVNIKPEDIHPLDIAFGLARECRFGNHTRKFWSVAEHSIWCMQKGEELFPEDFALHFRLLMHDAHEAYMGDLCTPMVNSIDKLYPGVKDAINTVKKIIQRNVNTRFGIGLCPLECEKVREIDRLALEWEWVNKVNSWSGLPPLDDKAIAYMWLHYFKKLVKVPVVIPEAA